MKNSDRDYYIKLYSIAVEEVRHHDRLYTQIWSAGVIVIGILFTAMGLLFLRGSSLVLKSYWVWIVIGLGVLILVCFYWAICRHAMDAGRCCVIARHIEDILKGEIPDEAIKLDKLLVMKKVKERHSPCDKEVYSWRLFYPILLLAIWVLICLALAGYII